MTHQLSHADCLLLQLLAPAILPSGRSSLARVDKGRFGRNIRGAYVPTLARQFPNSVKDSSAVPDAAEGYRRMLSQAEDRSVVIAAIGFLTALRDLLMSPPDDVSPLDGVSLVALKVRKVVFQGGWYHPLHPNGHTTFNWDCGACW